MTACKGAVLNSKSADRDKIPECFENRLMRARHAGEGVFGGAERADIDVSVLTYAGEGFARVGDNHTHRLSLSFPKRRDSRPRCDMADENIILCAGRRLRAHSQINSEIIDERAAARHRALSALRTEPADASGRALASLP